MIARLALLGVLLVLIPRAAYGNGDFAATAARGIAGEITFVYAGPPICVRANQSLTSSMLVRIATSPKFGEATTEYRLGFLGSIAGEFDLRENLEHCDGRAIDDLPPLRVQIYSQLPEQHGTDLFSSDHPQFALAGHYRLILGTIAVLWLLVPVAFVTRRMLWRPPAEAPASSPPAPTVADQLRPLVEAAQRQGLSVSEQGRLELLLLMFWRERLGIVELRPDESIGRLRADPQVGQLLAAVERWLHARGRASPQPEHDLSALLAPYAAFPAIVSSDQEPKP